MKSISLHKRLVLGAFSVALVGAGWTGLAQAGYQVSKTIPVTPKGDFDYLRVDPVTHHVFVALISGVAEVDPTAGKQVGAPITVVGQTQLRGVAVSPDGKYLFIGSYSSNKVSRLDMATHTVMGSASTGAGADGVLFDTATQSLFVSNHDGGSVTIVDANTMMATKTLPLGGSAEAGVSDGAGKVYINGGANVVEVDAKTMAITNKWPTGSGAGTGLAVDPVNHRLFVSTNGKLVVLNSENGMVVTTVPTGGGADGAGYDPATKLVFTSNGDNGTLSVIHQDSADKYTKVEDVKTASGCRTMTIDLDTHAVYTVCQAGTPKTMSLLMLADGAAAAGGDAGPSEPPKPASDAGTADTSGSGGSKGGSGGSSGAGGSTGTGGISASTGGTSGAAAGGSSGSATGGTSGSSAGGRSGSGSGGSSPSPTPAGTGSSSGGGGCAMGGAPQPAALAGLGTLVLALGGWLRARKNRRR